jgi:hypothetical protein
MRIPSTDEKPIFAIACAALSTTAAFVITLFLMGRLGRAITFYTFEGIGAWTLVSILAALTAGYFSFYVVLGILNRR